MSYEARLTSWTPVMHTLVLSETSATILSGISVSVALVLKECSDLFPLDTEHAKRTVSEPNCVRRSS